MVKIPFIHVRKFLVQQGSHESILKNQHSQKRLLHVKGKFPVQERAHESILKI